MTASQHPGEGRETGWEELRREIEALPDVNPTPTLHAGAHTDWPMVKRADVLRLLAAARGEPPEALHTAARSAGAVPSTAKPAPDAGDPLTEPMSHMTPEERDAVLALFKEDQQRQFERLAPKTAARLREALSLTTAQPAYVADLTAADAAASLVHDYVWQKPVLSGTTQPTQQQASDAIWTIHKVLRDALARLAAARGEPPEPGPAIDALEGMVRQFAYWSDGVGGIGTGGLSALEYAFEVLDWEDPHPLPDRRCDEPGGCMQDGTMGWPSPSGYRRTCWDHSDTGKQRAAESAP